MEVSYKIRPRDLIRNWIYSVTHFTVSKISVLAWLLLLAWLLYPLMTSGLLSLVSRGTTPVIHPLDLVLQARHSSLIVFFVVTAAPFVFTALSSSVYVASISSVGLAVTNGSTSKRSMFSWKQIKAVEEDGRYLYFRKFWYTFIIPKDAFPSSAEAVAFFETASAYWRDAKGIVLHPTPDVSGVWPPAPRAGDLQEIGDAPKH